MEEDVIRSGKYVVIQKVGGEHCRVVRLTPKQKILVEKLRFESDGCIGQRYGIFEVSATKATPISPEQRLEELRQNSAEAVAAKNESSTEGASTDKTPESDSKDIAEENETLNPAQAGQVVTQDEVLEMKTAGTSAKDLVEKLVQGNKSFANRTDFAQSKYIRRKMKKHSDRVIIMKPTLRLLASSYYTKDTDKFGMLRIDQLGLLIQMGHVVYNRNVLVIDQLLGIVTAAVLERLAGNGACIHLHRGEIAQSIPCLHSMNFDEETLAPYLPVRIKKFLGNENVEKTEKEEEMEVVDGSHDKVTSTSNEDATVRRAERMAREQRGLGFIAAGVDSLIVASRSLDVVDVLRILFPRLKPSGAVAIYHPDLQIIIRAQSWLMENNCLNVAVSEQMYRVHQVLPDRTHPLMTQHVAGGYVLSGIKILPPTPLS